MIFGSSEQTNPLEPVLAGESFARQLLLTGLICFLYMTKFNLIYECYKYILSPISPPFYSVLSGLYRLNLITTWGMPNTNYTTIFGATSG
jgi:hypothetical protein